MPTLYRALHDIHGAVDDSGRRVVYRTGATLSDKQIKELKFDGGLDRLLNKPGSDFYKPGFGPSIAVLPGNEDVDAPEVQNSAVLTANAAAAASPPSIAVDDAPKPDNTPSGNAPSAADLADGKAK